MTDMHKTWLSDLAEAINRSKKLISGTKEAAMQYFVVLRDSLRAALQAESICSASLGALVELPSALYSIEF